MIYLDNIIIFSYIMEKHIQYIRKILQVLRKIKLKLKLKKCEFVKSSSSTSNLSLENSESNQILIK